MNPPSAVIRRFKELFSTEPLVVRSPGRVNLLGEHTDYHDGFVLPSAIDKSIHFAASPTRGSECRVVALDLGSEHTFDVGKPGLSPERWPTYVMGVVDQLNRMGMKIRGCNCVFGGDIPIGAGLASSAALETGFLYVLNAMFDLGLSPLEMAQIAQRSENEFVGVQCGIMDQYASLFGRDATVLRLDCRSLKHEYIPWVGNGVIVLFDTGVVHALGDSEYNRRRAECALGVNAIKENHPEVTHLRDVTYDMLDGVAGSLSKSVYDRCAYVLEENDRVQRGCEALRKNDLIGLGAAMVESHEGLKKKYEVSCRELDILVDYAATLPGVYGCRLMGAGFGGCTINIVEQDAVDDVCAKTREHYQMVMKRPLPVYRVRCSAGTHVVEAR